MVHNEITIWPNFTVHIVFCVLVCLSPQGVYENSRKRIEFEFGQNPWWVCLQCSLTSLGGSGLEREIDWIEIQKEGDLISV